MGELRGWFWQGCSALGPTQRQAGLRWSWGGAELIAGYPCEHRRCRHRLLNLQLSPRDRGGYCTRLGWHSLLCDSNPHGIWLCAYRHVLHQSSFSVNTHLPNIAQLFQPTRYIWVKLFKVLLIPNLYLFKNSTNTGLLLYLRDQNSLIYQLNKCLLFPFRASWSGFHMPEKEHFDAIGFSHFETYSFWHD